MAPKRRNRSRKNKEDVRFIVIKPKPSDRMKLPGSLFHPGGPGPSPGLPGEGPATGEPSPESLPSKTIHGHPDRGDLLLRRHRDDHPWGPKRNVAPCAPRPVLGLLRYRVGLGRTRGTASGWAAAADPVEQGIEAPPDRAIVVGNLHPPRRSISPCCLRWKGIRHGNQACDYHVIGLPVSLQIIFACPACPIQGAGRRGCPLYWNHAVDPVYNMRRESILTPSEMRKP